MHPLIPILILGFVSFVTSFGAHVVAVNLPVYTEQVGAGVAGTFKEAGDMLGPLAHRAGVRGIGPYRRIRRLRYPWAAGGGAGVTAGGRLPAAAA